VNARRVAPELPSQLSFETAVDVTKESWQKNHFHGSVSLYHPTHSPV